jgi:hypothetical protein
MVVEAWRLTLSKIKQGVYSPGGVLWLQAEQGNPRDLHRTWWQVESCGGNMLDALTNATIRL